MSLCLHKSNKQKTLQLSCLKPHPLAISRNLNIHTNTLLWLYSHQKKHTMGTRGEYTNV